MDRSRGGRDLGRTLAVAGAALLALLLIGRLIRSDLGPAEPGTPATTAAPATTSERTPVLAAVDVGPGPAGRLAYGAGALWVVGDSGTLARVDPATNRVAATIRVAGGEAAARAVVAGADAVWVAVASPGMLVRVDPATNRTTATVRLGRPLLDPVGVAATDGAVWVTCCGRQVGGRLGGKLLRVDARTAKVTPVVLPREPLGIAADARQVWVSATDGSAVRVEPATGRVVGVYPGAPGGGIAQSVAVGAGSVWLAYPGGGVVARLDPENPAAVEPIRVDAATIVTAGGGAVWAVATNDQGVVAIDPRRSATVGGFSVSFVRDVRALAYGSGSLWVASGSSRVLRVDPGLLQP